MPKDYYKILGVSKDADLGNIKKAYKKVSKKYHPDTSHTEKSAERFLEVKEAYETLSNETKRKRHDKELAQQDSKKRSSRSAENAVRRQRTSDEMQGHFSAFSDNFLGDILSKIFNIGPGRRRTQDLYFEAVLSPREAAEGGNFSVGIPVVETCPRCRGRGFYGDFFCPLCSGYGKVKSEREISLGIPPQVKHGTELRLSMEDIGLGNVNLNLVVHIDPDLES